MKAAIDTQLQLIVSSYQCSFPGHSHSNTLRANAKSRQKVKSAVINSVKFRQRHCRHLRQNPLLARQKSMLLCRLDTHQAIPYSIPLQLLLLQIRNTKKGPQFHLIFSTEKMKQILSNGHNKSFKSNISIQSNNSQCYINLRLQRKTIYLDCNRISVHVCGELYEYDRKW